MQLVNAKQQLYVLIAHAIVSLFAITAVTVLAAMHVLDPQSVTTLFGVSIGLIGGSASSLAVVGFTGNGNGKHTEPPPQSAVTVTAPPLSPGE